MSNNNPLGHQPGGDPPSMLAKNRLIAPIPRTSGGRSTSRPSTPGITMGQGQSYNGPPEGSGRGLLGLGPSSLPITRSPSPAGTKRSRGFPSLAALQSVLDHGTNALGPLKAAIKEVADCMGTFERVSSAKKEYQKLHDELDALFETLRQHWSESAPPVLTSSIECLCNDIRKELRGVDEKLKRRRREGITGASVDLDEVMKCYDRVRDHLRRISLNADMSTWKILDESITDTRLRNMSPSLSACYNSAQATELKRGPCIANTRVEVLGQILGWMDNSSPGSVYWMSGMAGTGKTTIAYSLCKELDNVRQLAANFFCSRTLPECRDVKLIIPSIAYQLARSSHPFRRALSDALGIDPDAHTRLPRLQFDTLISQPLLQVADTLPHNLVVIIDALDECESKESTRLILDVLLTGALGLPVKFIVSSRPESEIRDEMTKQTNQAKSRVVLHELDRAGVQADIETYLRISLAQIQPSPEHIATLVQRAGVLFIYAATVVRYIAYKNFRGNNRARLENVLNLSSAVEKNSDIDRLYSTILQAALEDPDLGTTDIQDIRQVLHTVVCAREPLTVEVISQFLRIRDTRRVRFALEPLWSVLHISGSSELVTTLHASFPDYMFDPSRSHKYHCDPQTHNQTLALRCFDYFRHIRPQFNICNLPSSFVLDEEVAGLEERVKNCISDGVFYAARYWASHLCCSNGSPNLMERLKEFLSVRLLLWMEVMNLKKCAGSMAGIIRLLEKWDVDYPAGLMELIRDGSRFATTFSSHPVSDSTPHIYTSMLSFWPESRPIAKLYRKYTPRLIELEGTAVGRLQPALLAVWHYDNPESSIFSPDGSQIAVHVEGGVVLLNASTGQIELSLFTEHPFKDGDIYLVALVRFSPNGTLLVSTADTNHSGFCIWNVKSGKQLVQGDVGLISSTAFSPDGTRIAFGLFDGSIDVLDAHTGQHLIKLVLEAGDHGNIAIKYSLGGCHLVACSAYGNIVKWDDNGKQVHETCCQYEGSGFFESLDISPNCTHIATRCDDNIYIWDVETGRATLGPLHITPDLNLAGRRFHQVSPLSYSPDGLYLVSGLDPGDVCMWDAQTGSLLLHFPDVHKEVVCSVSFSPDGAYIVSSGLDHTVRLWDTRATQVSYDPPPGHTQPVTSAGFSPDGSRIVSGAMHHGVCVWNTETGELVFEPMKQHPPDHPLDWGRNTLVAYSSDGTRIMALTNPGRMGYWSPDRGDVLYPVHRSSPFTPAVLSEHSTCHLSALSSYPVQVLAAKTCDRVPFIFPPTEDNFDQVSVDIVDDNQPDNEWKQYNSLVMYDACTGDMLSELPEGPYIDSRIMQFSPSGAQVVGERDFGIVVYDIRSGDVVLGPLEGHTCNILSIHWSPDGTRIVSGAAYNSICVWDAQTGQRVLGPVKWHTDHVQSVRFSPDSTRVVSGSDDKTIRVTDVRMWADIVSDSPTPTGSDWGLNEDGWAVDDQGQLLAWVPPDMRTSLMYPRTKLLISKGGWLRMNFSNARLGESWTECYQPSLNEDW